ncbi:MAG TPA: UvrD-helicase domain-containing protein, partial [Candidatus Kryptobacter bacterium]|nr:UvrD-helicase domain-containing protein [Candidatus Kryptobacter bacterium]
MQSSKNRVIVACAGAGKTTTIVDRALGAPKSRILLTTYTNENVAQIRQCIVERHRSIPENITVEPWATFLLREGVRPYQNLLSRNSRVRSIFYPEKKNIYQAKDSYFTADGDIYGDKLSEFVFECNKASKGR